jgi:hypothetical protein
MKYEIIPYKSLFEGRFTPYAENGEVFFECDSCGKQPAREDRSDVGLPTQAYFSCSCYTGQFSIAVDILDGMKDFAKTMNYI